jgi:hypothetical protein
MMALVSSAPLQAATLVHWEADNTAGPGGANSHNPTFTAPSVTASAIGLSGGTNTIQNPTGTIVGVSPSGNPVFRASSASGTGTTWATATPTRFYSFNVDATGANEFGDNTLTIEQLSFYAVSSATNRTAKYQLDFSLDGTTFVTAGMGDILDVASQTWDEFTVPLDISGISDPVDFRLYLYDMRTGATLDAGATISIDDILISGDVVEAQAIPEPASLALWSVAALLSAAFGYRRLRHPAPTP